MSWPAVRAACGPDFLTVRAWDPPEGAGAGDQKG